MNTPINSFSGEYRFLSNFWPVPIVYEEIPYGSTEHAYQAVKTLDPQLRRNIAAMVSPAMAKKAGQILVLRADWDQVKLQVMEDLLRLKFAHAELAAQLKATWGRELIEGNNWSDIYWGVCRGRGENHLGKLLMKIRHEIVFPKMVSETISKTPSI